MVIRNGVVYRDAGAREGLAFYRDGHVELYDETATDAAALVDAGVWNTLSFGPALVADGKVLDGIDDVEVDTNFGNHSIQGDQPRTAVGVDRRQPPRARRRRRPRHRLQRRRLDDRAGHPDEGARRARRPTTSTAAAPRRCSSTATVVNQPSNGGERGTSDILYVKG